MIPIYSKKRSKSANRLTQKSLQQTALRPPTYLLPTNDDNITDINGITKMMRMLLIVS
jgi:hypothetical protein